MADIFHKLNLQFQGFVNYIFKVHMQYIYYARKYILCSHL